MAKAIQPQEPVDNFRDYLEATGNSEGLGLKAADIN